MKKLIINAFLVCAGLFAFSSCCKSDKCEQNCGSELKEDFVDTASKNRGALDGALNNRYVNANAEEVDQNELIDFIQGYQLIVGHNMSPSKIKGIEEGLKMAKEINAFESMTGSKFNRELYLREFRNFIQKKDLKQEDRDKLIELYEADKAIVEEFLATKCVDDQTECQGDGACAGKSQCQNNCPADKVCAGQDDDADESDLTNIVPTMTVTEVNEQLLYENED